MTQPEALASLCVLRWGKYLRSPHVLSPRDKEHEYKRLLAKKQEWAKSGRMPIPSDPESEPVSLDHVLRAMVGDMASLEPTNQEAYLFVEIVGRCIEFKSWKFLTDHFSKPKSWFMGGFASTEADRRECLRLIRHLTDSFEPDRG